MYCTRTVILVADRFDQLPLLVTLFRYMNTASHFLNNKNFFQKTGTFLGSLFPLLSGEENVLHSYFGTGCFFYALKTKLRLRKREKRLLMH